MSDVPPANDDLVRWFGQLADETDSWRRRNRGYHELVENVHRFHVPSGSAVLERCGTGELLAVLDVARPGTESVE